MLSPSGLQRTLQERDGVMIQLQAQLQAQQEVCVVGYTSGHSKCLLQSYDQCNTKLLQTSDMLKLVEERHQELCRHHGIAHWFDRQVAARFWRWWRHTLASKAPNVYNMN